MILAVLRITYIITGMYISWELTCCNFENCWCRIWSTWTWWQIVTNLLIFFLVLCVILSISLSKYPLFVYNNGTRFKYKSWSNEMNVKSTDQAVEGWKFDVGRLARVWEIRVSVALSFFNMLTKCSWRALKIERPKSLIFDPILFFATNILGSSNHCSLAIILK